VIEVSSLKIIAGNDLGIKFEVGSTLPIPTGTRFTDDLFKGFTRKEACSHRAAMENGRVDSGLGLSFPEGTSGRFMRTIFKAPHVSGRKEDVAYHIYVLSSKFSLYYTYITMQRVYFFFFCDKMNHTLHDA